MPHRPARIPETSRICRLHSTSPAGILRARVIVPDRPTHARPLLVLHGISRNAQELTDLFRPEAERCGRFVIVPRFSEQGWPHFQRPGRAARPDQALLSLLAGFAATWPDQAGPVDIFGHSGGAQLAHRFAMLFPQKAGDLHLGAAGWYCLPDDSMPYPYGLGTGGDPRDLFWIRRMQAALGRFLDRRISLYIGTRDTDRDDALRITPALDRGQGPDRLRRAHAYARALRDAAAARGLVPRVRLTELPGCAHDVGWAIRNAGLARQVMTPAPAPFPLSA